MLSRTHFIQPQLATLRTAPPEGPQWGHEVKFDGFRIQLHKRGREIALYSRSGFDYTPKYPRIAEATHKLPTRAVIFDGELTSCDPDGRPNFHALLGKRYGHLCVWVFDILSQNGKDFRSLPLSDRREKLSRLMERMESQVIQLSETFPDPHVLLRHCVDRKLEGIVSKRSDRPYVSGKSSDWIKVKCQQWIEENTWRHEFFQKQR